VIHNVDYEAELQRHNVLLRDACRIGRADRVLDIGCGTGQTTREAGRTATAGVAVGVDTSAAAIQRARKLARAEGLRNVKFIQADAEVHRFPSETFDIVISRFGTMFFRDPALGFANLARALRVGGRLTMMVWQRRELNEWDVSIQHALAPGDLESSTAPDGPDPFALGNADSLRQILSAAGFVDATLADVHEPVFYGRNVEEAAKWVGQFTATKARLQRLHGQAQAAAVDRLRATLAAHDRAGGVWFDSRAWIVTARRA
jgi:SAM-dependent methyltransferase